MKEIMLPYILICWLLLKLNIVKKTTRNLIAMVGGGVLLMAMLFFAHRLWSPVDLTNSTTVKAPHAILSPALGFEFGKVFVEHNQFVKKGDVIYNLVDTQQAAQLDGAVAQKAAADKTLEAAAAQIQSSTIAVKQARRQLNNLLGVKKFTSQDEIDQAQEKLATAQERLAGAHARHANAEAQVALAAANIANAEFQLERLTVRAPFDGMVTHVIIGEGSRIGAMHLFDTGQRFVEMRIPDQTYRYIEPGQFSEFAVDAYPGEIFRARVHSVVRATGEATANLFPGEQSVGRHIQRGAPNLGRTVILEFEEPEGYHIPIGATGTAWISASKPHPFLGFIDIIGGATVRLTAAKSYLGAF